MKLTTKEMEICKKYSMRDKEGYVHCRECPLAVDVRYSLCKANITKKEWKEYWSDKSENIDPC